MKTKLTPEFLPDRAFHVYNRTNNREILFHDDTDRWRFLTTYKKYLEPYFKLYAFCLLENHFHFQIRVRDLGAIMKYSLSKTSADRSVLERKFLFDLENEELLSTMLGFQFSRFFNSYAKYFNLRHSRKGNLFNRPFERRLVGTDDYFRDLILYIHTNPRKHFGLENYMEYPWSSCQPILGTSVFLEIEIREIFDYFGSKMAYLKAHDDWVNTRMLPV